VFQQPLLHSPRRDSVSVVLGQHFFNRTTDVTQTFGIEKYVPYSLYSVFNPSDHDLGKLWTQQGGVCPGHPKPEPRQGQEKEDRGQSRVLWLHLAGGGLAHSLPDPPDISPSA
jgi:hypothetical protein